MSFPKYPAYRSSGVEWLGEVPEHWCVMPFKWQIATNDGGVWGDEPNGEDDTIVLRSTDQTVDGNWKMTEPALRRLGVKEKANALLKEGDLVITKSSGSSLHIGKTTFVTLEVAAKECCFGNFMQRIRTKPTFTSKLAWYILNNEVVRFQLDLLSNSTTGLANLNGTLIGEVLLAIPAAKEQAQIVRFLDHETAKIDALVEEQQRLIELLQEKRQAVISHAMTKGLDPNVPMKDSGVEWLGEVPAHWVCKSYRYGTEIYRGKFGHRPRNDPSLYGGPYPFIQTGDIARAKKHIRTHVQTLNQKGAGISQKFPAGTLVMAIAANIGDTAILDFEAWAPDSVVGFKPVQGVEIEFLRFSLMAAIQELEKTATQSTQANLNVDRISSIQSVFPPTEEQLEIVHYLNTLLGTVADLETQAAYTIDLMAERRSALISAAVTGKIDVRDWQPPASTASHSHDNLSMEVV